MQFIPTAFVYGEKAWLIPIRRLQQVKNALERFRRHEELNGFQQWIVNDLYEFDVPNVEFSVRSIILIAIPHPFYAHVEFILQGKTFRCFSLVMSDFERADTSLRQALHADHHRVVAAGNLPLKRLAVQSGVAVYGRNNICYIDGMGSNFSFCAYFSDISCSEEEDTEAQAASQCANCYACVKNCPTGAIRRDRFVIDNEKCLSYLNERGDPFPAWVPKTAHHCVYDCLKCQIICPMNKTQITHTAGPVRFTESETQMLLSAVSVEDFPGSLKQKARYLGFHQWPDGIAKNLRTLIELSDQQTNDVK